MKALFLTLSLCFLLLNRGVAQIPKEAFPLSNSLYDLWHAGETKKAVENCLELYRLYPPMLYDVIHNTLAQQLQDDENKSNAIKFLEELYRKENSELNAVIKPVYLWSKAINTNESTELKKITAALTNIFQNNPKFDLKAERYCLLILKELDQKQAIEKKDFENILKMNIKSLESYPFIIKAQPERKGEEERAWYRYLLAYSYNYAYDHFAADENNLKKASDYSPDFKDMLNKHAYFYDAALLTKNTYQFGFKSKYQKYLVTNKRNKEALSLLCEITFGDPTDENIQTLKDMYYNTNGAIAPFDDYWANYISSIGKPVPNITLKFEKEELDFAKRTDYWVYIDVWGTWCSPCRKELPELQELVEENNNNRDSRLKIYTLSYGSQNLKEFLNENKYTFPVCEIDKNVNDLFEVSGYPTKILITPKGKYVEIPFGIDWRMYLKNYTLM